MNVIDMKHLLSKIFYSWLCVVILMSGKLHAAEVYNVRGAPGFFRG